MASGFPIEVNGVRIATSEALYQACRYPGRPDVQRMIIEQRSPMTAKMKGRRYLQDTRSDWQRIRVNVMRWCLKAKLAQNWDTFGTLLLSTGDAPIVEDSRRDDFWGAKLVDGVLTGMNVLGRLLAELREELKGPNRDSLRTIEPPRIPHFLLYSQTINGIAFKSGQAPPVEVRPKLEMAEPEVSKQPITGKLFHENDAETPGNRQDRSRMIPKECKRIAEVDFPIAEVSRHAAREKSIRHGHPSTLHLWWARRPLASSRAVLMALLMPDPCDLHCPDEFKDKARELLLAMRGRPSGWNSTVKTDEGLRQVLLRFIADFANWDNSAKAEYLETGRGLVQAAHPEQTPLVVDPFAGGGSIPLEALRLACDTFASDLNPVACLILKVMLEDIPRHGPGLAEELRKAGAEIKAQAEKELAGLYPKDPDGATPIAYLWARAVRCESPNCGAEIPLMRSMWLCKKPKRKWALRPNVVRDDGVPPRVEFGIFEPKVDREVADGTVTRARATCLCCRTVLPPERVRAQLAAQQGGADSVFDDDGTRTHGATMTAVVTLKEGQQGRHYRLPTDADYAAVRLAQERVEDLLDEWAGEGRQGLCPVPDEPLPPIGTLGFRVQRYGMLQWGNLFTARQKAALVELRRLTASAQTDRELLALALSRASNAGCSLCRWHTSGEKHEGVFSRQALPIVWDFSEGNPFSESTGNYGGAVDWVADVVHSWPGSNSGQVQQSTAVDHPCPVIRWIRGSLPPVLRRSTLRRSLGLLPSVAETYTSKSSAVAKRFRAR